MHITRHERCGTANNHTSSPTAAETRLLLWTTHLQLPDEPLQQVGREERLALLASWHSSSRGWLRFTASPFSASLFLASTQSVSVVQDVLFNLPAVRA
jgi:chromatin segregation and condensation protein Rec8/ScpA/Scc1 (kleisin family)